MRNTIIILITLFCASCSNKLKPKDYSKQITFKLKPPLAIELVKTGNSDSTFNIIATVNSNDPILTANISWIITDSENQKLSKKTERFIGSETKIIFDSGTIELENPELNHKIVFIFNGKTKSETIHKTKVYNSLLQEKLNRAIEDLQERNKY